MSAIKSSISKSLRSKIIDLIRLRGPISVADYMKIVLTNPESGFYMNQDVFGVKGHFTTSPEISQMFGELVGAWILQEWRRFSCPEPLRLIEFGPGRGTLMSDITRTISNLDKAASSIQVRLIEMSPKLQEIQKQNLAKQPGLLNRTSWFSHQESIDQDSDGFNAYIAHEFFDALPIHKFVRDPRTKKWRELLVDYNQEEELRFCISRQPSLSTRLLVPEDFEGEHLEVCPQAALHLERVSSQLNATQSGCMLVCDYGFEDGDLSPEADSMDENVSRVPRLKPIRSNRDTFRAFKNHEAWHPLKDPGDADLTADVDFAYLKKHVANKGLTFGTVDQKSFLLKCGLDARLDVLLNQCSNDEEREDLKSGASLLTDSMGQRYKFLALYPKDCGHLFVDNPPAGF